MTDPLLGHRPYVAEVDALSGALALRSNTPGPAGSLVVELDGLTLAFDAADPQLVNFIDVPDIAVESSLLRRLIGDTAVDAAATIVAARASQPRRIDTSDGAREQRVPARVARLAVALTGAETPGLLPEEHALAGLEALVIARNVGLFGDLRSSSERLAQAAKDVASLTDQQLGRFDRAGRAAAADACDLAAEWVAADLAAGLRSVAEGLRATPDRAARPGLHEMPAMAAAVSTPAPTEPPSMPSPPQPRPTRELKIAVTLDSLPLLTADRLPSVTRTSNDEYEVRIQGWAERANGWWVRAFRPDGHVPLAAVPMRDEGDDTVAHLLLPQRDGADFELDIVDDPGAVRSSSRVAAFRAAIASGQRAARLERLDRRDAAAHAWQRSSELHAAAGDDDRSRQAEAIASNQRAASLRFSGPQVGATIADQCLPMS